MRRSAVAVSTVVAAAAMLFVACSERDTTSPRLPGGANFSVALTYATSCDFTQISKAAKNYFTSAQDPVYTLIGNMKQAGGGTAAATTIGWSILRQVAAERLSSATGASTDGAVFVNDVLRCTTYTFPPTASPDVKQNFLDNLALVLSGGVFNVRGSGYPSDPAAALDGSPQVFAQPRWGVEAVSSWPTGPALIWGYPVLIPNVVVDPATNINTNGTGGPYNGFELGTMPDATPKTGLRVGVCYPSTSNGNTANRLIHNNSEILVNDTPGTLCTMTTPVASIDARAWYTRALARAASLLAPATAHAMQSGLEIGGLPSSWSPFASGALLGSNILLTFPDTAQPNDAVVGGDVHFVVHAAINGAAVPGTDITVSIDNNQGVPAGAVITGGTTTVTTNKQGDATFDITIGKPGGYLIAASGSLTGVTTSSGVSAQFHIKNP